MKKLTTLFLSALTLVYSCSLDKSQPHVKLAPSVVVDKSAPTRAQITHLPEGYYGFRVAVDTSNSGTFNKENDVYLFLTPTKTFDPHNFLASNYDFRVFEGKNTGVLKEQNVVATYFQLTSKQIIISYETNSRDIHTTHLPIDLDQKLGIISSRKHDTLLLSQFAPVSSLDEGLNHNN